MEKFFWLLRISIMLSTVRCYLLLRIKCSADNAYTRLLSSPHTCFVSSIKKSVEIFGILKGYMKKLSFCKMHTQCLNLCLPILHNELAVSFEQINKIYTVKMVGDIPVPSRDVTNQTFPGRELCNIPAGDWNIENFFFTV